MSILYQIKHLTSVAKRPSSTELLDPTLTGRDTGEEASMRPAWTFCRPSGHPVYTPHNELRADCSRNYGSSPWRCRGWQINLSIVSPSSTVWLVYGTSDYAYIHVQRDNFSLLLTQAGA
jgi:hypothetical protein